MSKRKTRTSLLAGLTPKQQMGLARALLQYAECLKPEESRNAVAPSVRKRKIQKRRGTISPQKKRKISRKPKFNFGKVCVFCGTSAGWFYDEDTFNEHAKHCPCEPSDINTLVEKIVEWNGYSYEQVRFQASKISDLAQRKGGL